MAGDESQRRKWRDRVWAERNALANVEHVLERDRDAGGDVLHAGRLPGELRALERQLRESAESLATIAREMAEYRERSG